MTEEGVIIEWVIMNRKFSFSVDEYYHLYQRGTNREQVFSDDYDRLRLLTLLYVCNTTKVIHLSDYWRKSKTDFVAIFNLDRHETIIDIGAYCLMPNHFHLLVKEKEENGISDFMKKLTTGYSMYFNKKNNRTGAVFEKPFKAQHVADDRYLEYLFAYIHLNPVKIKDPNGWGGKKIAQPAQAEKFLNEYRFSSYQYYLGKKRPEDRILNPQVFPDYFLEPNSFNSFITDWLTIDLAHPLSRRVLDNGGKDEFGGDFVLEYDE